MRLLIVFILFPLFVFAQINERNIYGGWAKTKVEMKDGSRVLDRVGTKTGFLLYAFGNDGSVYFGVDPLLNQSRFKYQIKDSIIDIAFTSYQIIKLTKDSLILQDNDPTLTDDKLVRYYFAKLETHHDNEKPVYNDAIKDSVYNITHFNFPQSIGATHQITDGLRELYANGKLKLSFIITKNGKLKELKVLENDSLSKSDERRIVAEFERTQTLWVPGRVDDKPVNIALDMTTVFKHSNNGSYLGFITPFNAPKNNYKIIPPDIMAKENVAFNEGVVLAKNHEYDKALIQFTKCLEIDEINLDAYYLRAAINLKIGNKKAACGDWEKLAQLGQVPAIKCIARYCGN